MGAEGPSLLHSPPSPHTPNKRGIWLFPGLSGSVHWRFTKHLLQTRPCQLDLWSMEWKWLPCPLLTQGRTVPRPASWQKPRLRDAMWTWICTEYKCVYTNSIVYSVLSPLSTL